MTSHDSLSAPASRQEYFHTAMQAAELLGQGLYALVQFSRELQDRTNFRREQQRRAALVRLCGDRVKMMFDIPLSRLDHELGRVPGLDRPLSLAEILRLYERPEAAQWFSANAIEAIDEYQFARRYYSELKQPGSA